MAQHCVIVDYLAALSGRLPTEIVDELAGGLADTHQAYLDQGLEPGPAAEAAVVEFGEPDVIVAAFLRANPTRLTARKLLAIGPCIGVCWAAALITSHAWSWPIPALARVVLGLTMVATIGLLAAAALSPAYRLATRAGLAACVGTTAADTAMITGVVLTAPSITWLTAAALAGSAARVGVAAPAVAVRVRAWLS